ncbi:MAG: hypothetical protein ACK5FT_07480 [Sphingomonadales bacterium]|jgi:hypothetical protein
MTALNKNKSTILFSLICLSVVLKIAILGSGLYTFPDEFRYVASQDAFEAIMHGDWQTAVKKMYAVDGRPALVLLGLIPAAAQILTANFFMIPYNCQAIDYILYGYNLLIFLFILRLLYVIGLKTGLQKEQSLLAVLIYACGVNAWLYIRHAFPYDTALLMVLFTIIYLINNADRMQIRHAAFTGFLLALSFALYPGFYVLIAAVVLVYAWIAYSRQAFLKLSAVAGFTGLLVLAFFEILAKVAGTSYLLQATELSGTIVFGDFADTLLFPAKYLWKADYVIGIIVLIGSFIALIQFGKSVSNRSWRNQLQQNLPVLFSVSAMLALFAFMLQGPILGKMVFYGRTFHQFYPFMILLFCWWLFKQPKLGKPFVLYGIAGLALLTNLYVAVQYRKVDYPRNFSKHVNAHFTGYKKVVYDSEMKIPGKTMSVPHDCFPYLPVETQMPFCADTAKTLVLVNNCYMWLPDIGTVKQEYRGGGKVIYRKPHFTCFYPYLFEGAEIVNREMYEKSGFEMIAIEK